ncbi:hypothetical protein ACS0PU_000980 [Formica fusca]
MTVGHIPSVSSTGVRYYVKLTKDVAVMRLCEISAKLCFEESSKFRRIYFEHRECRCERKLDLGKSLDS